MKITNNYVENCDFGCKNASERLNFAKNTRFTDVSPLKLSEMPSNKVCKVVSISAEPRLRRRLLELGFVTGATVQVVNISPMSRAFLLVVQNSLLCIRRDVLEHIEVDNLRGLGALRV